MELLRGAAGPTIAGVTGAPAWKNMEEEENGTYENKARRCASGSRREAVITERMMRETFLRHLRKYRWNKK
jgi:hypothetical protein